METLSLIGNAFAGMMNPMSILLLIVGVAVGIVFGSIPGLSAAFRKECCTFKFYRIASFLFLIWLTFQNHCSKF